MADVEKVTETLVNTSIENGKLDDFWGFSLHEAFRMAIKFYKDNEGKKTLDGMPYDDKVYLSALTKQVSHGPLAQQHDLPDIGFLDMFGHDRRKVWSSLADISSNDARRKFIHKLTQTIPVFAPFMVAHQKEKEEQERQRQKKEEAERLRIEEEKRKKEEEEQRRNKELEEQREAAERAKQEQDQQKQQIMAALNAQTHAQFQQYAAQQYPGNQEQQAILISQLQEQHYQQYMKLYLQQQQQSQQQPQTVEQQQLAETSEKVNELKEGDSESTGSEDNISEASLPRIVEASLWTRPQLIEFKDQIKRDPESVLTVGRGEVVTVRVPTHEEGAYVFWEFATDYYDLGFGVFFEWTDSTNEQQVSVQVGESSEEESDEEGGDLERGGHVDDRPPMDEIVPVYRRDCHTEVHAGSHRYPGRGVYLLKFDNSYSLWRSKTLYYRVYYTR
ncbi:Golgi resident protein GCP60-like [Clavelina lepadiformis]|uniref:Golgi resident protein GCP60-like n=1 Tax=Clavelina lepadiformis TaxID=159417 RepID=UPI00404350FF